MIGAQSAVRSQSQAVQNNSTKGAGLVRLGVYGEGRRLGDAPVQTISARLFWGRLTVEYLGKSYVVCVLRTKQC